MKKNLITFVLASGLLGFIGCICRGIPDFWRIEGIRQIYLSGKAGELVQNGIITADTLILSIQDSVVYHSSIFSPCGFTATLSALSCQEPGSKGTKDTITDLEVSSNIDFNQIKAGSSLVPLLSPRYYSEISVQEQIHKLNVNEDMYFWNVFDYEFLQKPVQNVPRTFKVKLSFQSGRTIEAESAEVTWK